MILAIEGGKQINYQVMIEVHRGQLGIKENIFYVHGRNFSL